MRDNIEQIVGDGVKLAGQAEGNIRGLLRTDIENLPTRIDSLADDVSELKALFLSILEEVVNE